MTSPTGSSTPRANMSPLRPNLPGGARRLVPLVGPMTSPTGSSTPQENEQEPRFELWDLDTRNLIATFDDAKSLARFAYGLGQANSDPEKFPASELGVIETAALAAGASSEAPDPDDPMHTDEEYIDYGAVQYRRGFAQAKYEAEHRASREAEGLDVERLRDSLWVLQPGRWISARSIEQDGAKAEKIKAEYDRLARLTAATESRHDK